MLIEKFKDFFIQRNQQQLNFLAAVSGGIDSVVLCELCHLAGISFSIAHCNFQLRGSESQRDEDFVRILAEKYNVRFFIKKFDTEAFASEKKISIQEAARLLRYEWFDELRKENKLASTILGHHAGDNIETLLMNFFRGTGLPGMTGMPDSDRERGILRPMLDFNKKDILDFAKHHDLQWVEDSSNSSLKYTRNSFRHDILPAIKKIYPQAEENLKQNIERFNKIESLYNLNVTSLKEKICEAWEGSIRIPVKKLMQYKETALIYEIIKDYGFGENQVEEVIKLANAESGKFIENQSYQLIRHGNWFIMASRQLENWIFAIEKGEEKINFISGILEFKQVSKEKWKLDRSEQLAQLDAKHIEYPLVLRKWKQGDYFYPFGMKKKKKLARFFIDQKLSKNQKEKVWLIESNKKIVWVVGIRIDERFRVTDSTRDVLKISLTGLSL